MAVRSIYLPSPVIKDDHLHIRGDEHRHLSVARAVRNEVIEVFDGRGTVWTVSVESVAPGETIARIIDTRVVTRDPVQLIMALAIVKMSAFELALEKIAEVGVTRVVPFTADRSNVEPGNRQERWSRILTEAVKQSKQYYLPTLDRPLSFDQVIAMPAASKIMFAEHDGGSLKSALAGSPVLCLIGPEGGWTNREITAARDSGFHPVTLGAAILKAETAAIVGASLVRYELGQ